MGSTGSRRLRLLDLLGPDPSEQRASSRWSGGFGEPLKQFAHPSTASGARVR